MGNVQRLCQRGEVQLGDVVRDSITTFEGVAIGITDWLNGCRRIIVQPRALHEGKPVEAINFDEPQLIMVTPVARPVMAVRTGGPRPAPTRRPDPVR